MPKRSGVPAPHQVFPVLDATSPSLNDHPLPNEEFTHKSFTINYAKRLIDSQCVQGSASDINNWRIHSVTLYNNDKMIVKEWFDTLTRLLNGEEAISRSSFVKHIHLFIYLFRT